MSKGRGTRLLLDVNVWIALLDDAHVRNAQALALFQEPGLKVATCPLLENGVLRSLNLPGYSLYGPAGFEAVRAKVALACDDVDHAFWADDIILRTDGLLNWSRVFGHSQVTDLYLLTRGCKPMGHRERATRSAVKAKSMRK